MRNYAIIREQQNEWPGGALTPRTVAQEGEVPMRDNDTPNDNLIPYGYCHCGCGEKTNLASRTWTRAGWVRGEPLKYLQYHKPGGSKRADGREGVLWSSADQCFLIPLSKGKFAKVDSEDIENVAKFKWTSRKGWGDIWYAYRTDKSTGKQVHVSLHRFIIDAPAGSYVDHINHDGLDNRRSNLRLCTNQENALNIRGPQSNNRSGYLGVFWSKSSQKWSAQISAHGKKHHLGLFDTPRDAAIARDIKAIDLHQEFASLNFPELREVVK